jgi:quercetin dioxygenase-like cupin family protein
MSEAIIIDKNSVRPLNVVGEHLTVLVSGDQTGSFEVFHQAGAEGSGPPPHSHPWDEAFYVVRGEIAFGAGDKQAIAHVGTFVHVPGGTVHWFRFGPGGGEMVSLTSREGAAKMFAEFDREIAPDQPDLAKLARIAESHGTRLAVPPG